jgi:4-diphosphocytidyl-2-C-methyl-D-erythritol kinase
VIKPVREFAPAKVNLALHVTARRGDGYHHLDSLVVFAGLGDWLETGPGQGLTLAVKGPQAAGLPVQGNLVLKAAARSSKRPAGRTPAQTSCWTNTFPPRPGSAGDHPTRRPPLRALNRLWDLGLDTARLTTIGATIGADVPVCVPAASARIQGIGDHVTPSACPARISPGACQSRPRPCHRIGVCRTGPAMQPRPAPAAQPMAWLGAASWNISAGCRNDLAGPAMAAEPTIIEVLTALAGQRECLLARMSGSGATCFGLFATAGAAAAATAALSRQKPHWWVAAAPRL